MYDYTMDNLECLFCRIIKKEIPSHKIYEDELCLAFLDLSQTTRGHTLLIPKKHFTNMLDCEEKYQVHLSRITKLLLNHYQRLLGTDSFNIINNSGPFSGQTIYHYHIHIIPRYKDDKHIKIVLENAKPTSLELKELSDLLLLR